MIDYQYLIFQTAFYCLAGAITGAWAFLFTGPLSESGMVFGWLKRAAYNNCPEWLYLLLIGCAKCNAFWWAVAVCAYLREFSAPFFVSAVLVAFWFEKNNS